MQMPQRKLKDIKRLLAGFPPINGDPSLVLHNYLMAVDDWHADLVEDAVTLIIKGELPGHDGRFVPTAPMVATACRLAAEKQARAAQLNRLSTPALPAPDIVHSPEQRAKAKAEVEAFIASQGPALGEQQVLDAAAREKMAKHDSFFADDFVPVEGGVGRISKTLAAKLGYSVGSPESEENAA